MANVEGASDEPDGFVVPCVSRPLGAGEEDPAVVEPKVRDEVDGFDHFQDCSGEETIKELKGMR